MPIIEERRESSIDAEEVTDDPKKRPKKERMQQKVTKFYDRKEWGMMREKIVRTEQMTVSRAPITSIVYKGKQDIQTSSTRTRSVVQVSDFALKYKIDPSIGLRRDLVQLEINLIPQVKRINPTNRKTSWPYRDIEPGKTVEESPRKDLLENKKEPGKNTMVQTGVGGSGQKGNPNRTHWIKVRTSTGLTGDTAPSDKRIRQQTES